MKKLLNIGNRLTCRNLIVNHLVPGYVTKYLFLIFFIALFLSPKAFAQYMYAEEEEIGSFAYDGVPVLVIVEGYESFYVDALYANNDMLYINIEDLFHTLGISCNIKQNGNVLSGFIENEKQTYSVDFTKNQIKVGNKVISAQQGLLKESGAIYLEASLFAETFGITLTFNYRALTVILKSDFELPIIKQQQIDKLRSNVLKIKGEEVVDTIVQRNYNLFKFGNIDWALASYQKWDGFTDNRIGLGIGTELLYGELNVSVNYYDRYKFDNRQLYYLWRWVDNEKKLIKQAQVGKISTQTIAFINSPIIGATIRNSPTTVRKAKGYYTINEYTEPNWDVELYINNVMVDYTKADASGLFTFKVPIVYGYTTLKMVFYGPMGEERTEERVINMPYTIIPTNEFEYGLSAGMLQDSSSSRFGRGDFNYGINRYLTVGGGLEYLSSIPNGAFIPFARATIQPYSKLTLNIEYAHGVKARGILHYNFLKNALLEIDYSKYVEGQLATRFNALEERKVKVSIPFRIKRIVGFSRINYAQLVNKAFNYNQASVVNSFYYKQFSVNSTTQINWINNRNTYATSIMAMSYRSNGYVIRPSAQYNITNSKLMLWKIALEKRISRGFLSASYEQNLMYAGNFINVGFKYDLSFARTSISASHSRGNIYTSQSAQGSLAFGSGNEQVHAGINNSVGKGGISLYPFLDLNGNGIFDEGEPMVKLSTVRVMGSKAIFSETDSIIRIASLNPFTKYVLTFRDTDLESIAWRFKHKTYEVLVDPNQFKRIDIPILVVGEYSGMAYLNQNNTLIGIGRMLVKFYKQNSSELVTKTQTERDGYIYHLGFEPGNYTAKIDSAQLSNLGYTSEPNQIDFTIKPSIEGDMVMGADFVLNEKSFVELPKIELSEQVRPEKEESMFEEEEKINVDVEIYTVDKPIDIQKDKHSSDFSDENAQFWGDICNEPGKFYVQCGAFRVKSNATNLALFISQKTDKAVGISFIDGYYKVQVGCVISRKEADEIRILMEEIVVNTDMFFKARRSKDVIDTPAP
ncbi:MAG: SPOR domain-containing protein [Perlabentimonas sp.]